MHRGATTHEMRNSRNVLKMYFEGKLSSKWLLVGSPDLESFQNTCFMSIHTNVTGSTILIDGARPAAVDKRQAALYLGCRKLVDRMLWAARHQPRDPWIEIAHNRLGRPKATTLIDARSLEAAYARILAGEEPPYYSTGRHESIDSLPDNGCPMNRSEASPIRLGNRAKFGPIFGPVYTPLYASNQKGLFFRDVIRCR